MHKQAWDWLAKQAETLPKTGSALDVGGRNINGNPRELFPGYEWTVVDQVAGPGVDIVGDFLDDEILYKYMDIYEHDLVLCSEVLEHVPFNLQGNFLWELCNQVKIGGTLLVTAACDPREPHNCNGSRPCDEPYCNVADSVFDIVRKQFLGEFSVEHDKSHGDVYCRFKREE